MTIYLKTLAGRELYRSSQIIIRQNLWYRWLIFQDPTCIQTLINRHHPQKAVMPYLLPFTLALRSQPGPTCLLGLGGAAVLHVAAPYLAYYPITAVETNAEVISLSRQYFKLNAIPLLTVVHSEAESFISQSSSSFAHVLVDLYSDKGFPETCAQSEFFHQCKRLLQPNGFLALNLVNIRKELSILQHLRDTFEQATVCIPVPKSANMVVLAGANKETLLSLIYTRPNLKSFVWDSAFGHVAKFSPSLRT